MTPDPEWIAQEIKRQTNAKMRDHNKAEAEKEVTLAVKRLRRAVMLYEMAECPGFAAKIARAADDLSEGTAR